MAGNRLSGIAYVNGRYVARREASVHIEDRGYQFADGVYEVIAVKAGRLIDEELHYDRLDRSLGELHFAAPCSRRSLRVILHQVIKRNAIRNGIVYLQATRGIAPRNHAFPPSGTIPSLVVTASRVMPPSPGLVEEGVAVICLPETRWARRDIKSISLLPNILAKQQALQAGAYEAWFVDDSGMVTEGSSTNAWIVVDGQEVVTRPLGPEILAGITRYSLMEAAKRANIKITEREFSVSEACSAQEAFITSTTSLVLSVVLIDGKKVGDGAPGPVSRALLRAYQEYVATA
jgi:D-alanine transaminase